jgi:CheY-like chemotaxis protein
MTDKTLLLVEDNPQDEMLTLRALKRANRADPRTRLLPEVILTSSGEERDRFRSYEHGANSFVRKPVGFAEFPETMAHPACWQDAKPMVGALWHVKIDRTDLNCNKVATLLQYTS